MALGAALKQSYFGRVVRPAQINTTQNGKSYLNFDILVDGLIFNRQDKSRSSGRISCSYAIRGEVADDRTAIILANIYNSETNAGSLAGQTYKSVEVIVEGTPEFVLAGEGGGVYVNLNYVTVRITDNNVLQLFRAQQQQTQPAQAQPQTTANTAAVAPGTGVAPTNGAVHNPQAAAAVAAQAELSNQSTVIQGNPTVAAPQVAQPQPTAQVAAPAPTATVDNGQAAGQSVANLLQGQQPA